MRGSLQSYRKVSLDSSIAVASPHKVIQMMFAGALERLAQGRYAIEQNNLELKGVSLGKAVSIVAGLNSSLNMEAEGDVAGNLSALYDFMLQRITDANINNDTKAIDDATDILRVIKEAWDAIPSELHELSSQN
ncbi:flagellar export chaperone FliS [Shewanella pealeana]|uniref:Flagellar secretion chaperone FliS n=1 Tax=Shewanella pealeana (strain ATCC 700345 / ANG-SQ1) TaxID=398579 RepID=A8H296_SHEPA|nr:flagellar export chaperone FliS [Shewanella pealeana]ABV86683.1 flagellar protein FliS [Shewanella pealeana ATCC 700345]